MQCIQQHIRIAIHLRNWRIQLVVVANQCYKCLERIHQYPSSQYHYHSGIQKHIHKWNCHQCWDSWWQGFLVWLYVKMSENYFMTLETKKNVRKIISRRSPKMSVKCLLKLLQCQKCFQFSTFFSFGREKCQQWIWKYQKIDVEMSDNSHVVSLPKCLKKLVF